MLIWMGVGLWVLALCAGRSTKSQGFQQTTWPSRPLSGLLEVRGRAGTAPNPWNLPALGVPPQTPQKNTDHPNGRGFGVLLYCLTAKKSFAGRHHCGPRTQGGFTLPHRAVGTLGRGPQWEPLARHWRVFVVRSHITAGYDLLRASACVCCEITQGVRFLTGIVVCMMSDPDHTSQGARFVTGIGLCMLRDHTSQRVRFVTGIGLCLL